VCTNVLLLSPSEAKKRKFCSGTCRNKVNNQLIKGSRSKAEKMLEEALTNNFPEWEILFNDRKTLNGLELDVYIPHLKFAIEWNGVFHFNDIHNNGNLSKVFAKDQKKVNMCSQLGISLLTISDRTSHTKFIKETVNSLIDKLKEF